MLTGKQKRFLRAMGTALDPIVHVGKGGVVDNLIKQVDEALEARELVKIKVLNNCLEEVDQVAEQIASAAGAEVAQTIGRTLLLYRPSKQNHLIDLP